MRRTYGRVRVGGTWLAVASGLMIATLVLHGPIAPDLNDQITALWTLTTAVAEATAVTDAVNAGNAEMFEAWWAFAEGKATGFAFLALAVAVIAGNEAQRTEGVTPAWAAWTAMVAGVASFTGWALGM